MLKYFIQELQRDKYILGKEILAPNHKNYTKDQ